MIDAMTRKPLRISIDGTAAPYIVVPFSQLAELCDLLEAHDVTFTVDEDVISLDGEPEIATVDLGHAADVPAVQAILDGAS